MKIDILTLFPGMFAPVTEESMIGRACRGGILDIRLHDIRDYTQDKHNRTDDTPFGGGGGMVQMPDPIFRCMEDIGAQGKRFLYMSPRGRIIDQQMLEKVEMAMQVFI